MLEIPNGLKIRILPSKVSFFVFQYLPKLMIRSHDLRNQKLFHDS